MTLVTSLGAFNLTIRGRGIVPAIVADTMQIDFGKVGAGMPELRELTLKNTAELPIEVHLKVDAADDDAEIAAQFHVPATLALKPNESVKVPVEFHPGDGTSKTDADARVIVSVPLGPTSDGTRVTSIGVRARTGKFQVVARGGSRELAFAKVEAMEMSTLAVEFENTGEVVAVLALAEDEVGAVAAKAGRELVGKANVASFGCKPISQTIEPGAIGKFSLTATGMREGTDTRSLVFFTPNLMRPVLFSFNASITVSAARDVRGLQSFAKSDSSVEEKLQIEVIERPKFKSDEGLWSVLLPVVKVEAVTPSDPHYSFPAVRPQEPLLQYASIVHHLTRPAALPTALLPPGSASKSGGGAAAAATSDKLKPAGFRSKNRAPMPMAPSQPAVDPAAREVPAVMAKMQMQREALATLAPLEKRLFNGGGGASKAVGPGGKSVPGSKKYR
ncbi:hypothetical protein BCR44DRAFT_1445045 [Catenaria anguillulae PL171]|uniref:Abnormal spindle-like microcephaly-associated protein ASH domain-containing protein n=1 Tax=Catenaria anguillulae PL171 TaxID=765915 RepID=A0A1Y2H727_9FUNG|nr:hypothetical protein BCR44DRAFT_1445045 [Catenaria anguillulae PL171]